MSWLWRGDSSSPASYEKALLKISQQITAANLALDTSRSRARRSKALWTLYTTLTYLVFVLIVFLVLGPKRLSVPHYGGLIGAPLTIYGVRQIITLFFDWRIERQHHYLVDLQKQRDGKIADLKKATKYDSTQELLQKYGGSAPKQTPSKLPQQGTKLKIASQQDQVQRTGIAPPPTANIPGRNAPPQAAPQRPNFTPPSSQNPSLMSQQALSHSSAPFSPDAPEFAPNAFSLPPPSAPPAYSQGPQWYDRILDVLLGEDETAAKNRMALICSDCRLVNGQAPPGVKTLEEVGKWRCGSCGTMNGVESEARKAVKEMTETLKVADEGESWEKVAKGDDEEVEDVEIEDSGHATTAREAADDTGVTKRVTRSAQKEPLEALE